MESNESTSALAQPEPSTASAVTDAKVENKSPGEWRDVLFPVGRRGRRPFDDWKHAAAESLHGWIEHFHHRNAQMLLSREDYEAALDAASAPVVPDKKSKSAKPATYQPHRAALSEHAPIAKKVTSK